MRTTLSNSTRTSDRDVGLVRPVPSSERVRRRLSATCLVIAAVALAAAFSLPHAERDDAAKFYAFAADHQTEMKVVGLLSVVVVLALIPGLAGVAHALRSTCPRGAYGGAGLMIAGFVAYLALPVVDAGGARLVEAHRSVATLRDYLDAATSSVVLNVLFVLFLVGHVVAPTVLAVAGWRGRLLPGPLAAVLPVGALMHFAAEGAGATAVDIVAFFTFAAGLVLLGWGLVRHAA